MRHAAGDAAPRVDRREGCDESDLGVLAAADPLEFLGTRRLEEEAGGAYTWRSILKGLFRSPLCCRPLYPFLFCPH